MIERHHGELLNFLARLMSDRDAAADLAQESYARVLALVRTGAVVMDARALLHHTARNLMIDRHRRNALRRHEPIETLSPSEQPALARQLQPEQAYAQRQRALALLAAIDALPARSREAFALNRFDGLSHQQVAARMGISKNMVAQHVMRAMLACKACDDAFEGQSGD